MNIAIVGAGPVGIYFAKLCIEKGHNVTLIESGNTPSRGGIYITTN